MVRFLRNYKALVRASNAIGIISVDQDLLPPKIANMLDFLGDTVVKLTSFKEHSELKIGDYDGTIKLQKQVRLHGLLSHMSPFDIYALKLTKNKSGINIEQIHLEPEEDRTNQDENLEQKGASKSKVKKISAPKNELDF